jgi:hypothetical protein
VALGVLPVLCLIALPVRLLEGERTERTKAPHNDNRTAAR